MEPEPFFSQVGQDRISPDEDALPFTRQKRMGAAGDRKVDAGGRQCSVASIQNEQDGEQIWERDGGVDTILSSHRLGL